MNERFVSYLLTFDTTQTSRQELLTEIEQVREIANWYAFMPAAVCLISRSEIGELHRLLKARLPGQRFILVTLERGKRQGWLPKSVWEFINEARPVASVASAAE